MSENGEVHNETPSESEKMDISEISDHPSAESDQSPAEPIDNHVAQHQEVDNATAIAASVTSTATTPSRGRADSALSLEGLDLELPTLDAYQAEYVDFPSSPKHLKECFEANGIALPLERDSGTAGRSEEEDDEDTSIYQAVLSPDCRDVRLRKERMDNVYETTQDMIEAILAEDDDDIEDHNGTPQSMDPGSEITAEKISRRVLVPNLNDLSLADVYNSSGSGPKVTLDDSEVTPPIPGRPSTSSTPERADKTASVPEVMGDERGFVVESHDSSLAWRQYGKHVIKGLFMESPLRNLPLKRVSAPQKDLLDSPKEEEEPEGAECVHDELTRQPAYDAENVTGDDCNEVVASVPVPSPRTKPVPKTRTVLTNGSESTSNQQRGPVLILDPSKLDLKLARRTPQISEDGSVEKLKE